MKSIKKEKLNNIFNFLSELDKLKNVKRYSPVAGRKFLENDAEHTWHTAMWFLALEPFLGKKINSEKILRMLLIHDLPEIFCGDILTFSKNHEHRKEEKKCARKIFKMLPIPLAAGYLKLWKEFEKGGSDEAKIARAMDKLQPLLQHTRMPFKGWKWNGDSIKIVERNKQKHMEFDEIIFQIYKTLMNKAKLKAKKNDKK